VAKKPSRAARRRSALKGWRTRRKNERRKYVQKETKRISKKSTASRSRSRDTKEKRVRSKTATKTQKVEFQRRSAAAKLGWKRHKQKEKKKKKKIVADHFPRNREYFVVLIFSTRKWGRTVTRRLYEAIVTLPDGATDEEVLAAYQTKIQEQHPRLHNREIERFLFGPNAGRTVKIIPRDTPGSNVSAGSVRVNDARKPRRSRVHVSSKPKRVKRKTKKRKA
jgi:hypothetical protein